ncbi:hypothetical protein [Deinococcus gobiensis]|uniref:Uncharacterized protein n=1 Tax=Deinococcus gobiensis (strain DSM 21396 / JCM 16679 / CGMCC 1.7299 / I-0) TaxID=745776 RepID=H8H3H3_DEIGI|nr:hypothetical protein [Deinococcus gobiensis]AFD28070.1 hypothetical protein DGo_PC0278 [Deinococcus gobiensis I-0]
MQMTQPITPEMPDRVTEALRLLITCCREAGGPRVETLRQLDRSHRGILVLPPEFNTHVDHKRLSEQELVGIIYRTFKRAERLAESEAKYLLGSSDRGARA